MPPTDVASRSSSSAIPARPITPPPPLPAPTLHELGLSMTMITSILSPSHFSSPPCSGAFLSPHYLLLCHAQGLDVLPLTSPPAPIPYALVRRVPFKHVVVMEQRGVLVAIAGRRDGVRVYALDEVCKAVEWRIEVELRRERERARREEAKRITSASFDDSGSEFRGSEDKVKSVTPTGSKSRLIRKLSSAGSNTPPRTPKPKSQTITPVPPPPPVPRLDEPPPYSHSTPPERRVSAISAHQLVQRNSQVGNDILPRDYTSRRSTQLAPDQEDDSKADWGSSDDEAIDIVAAGASGSQALDERTSAMASASTPRPTAPTIPRIQTSTNLQPRDSRRPANLDLSLVRTNSQPNNTTPPPPSPTPTLITLRQALQSYPSTGPVPSPHHDEPEPTTPDGDDEVGIGNVSLAQMLMESRIPNLPPAGTRRAQQPILTATHPLVTGEEELPSPRSSESIPMRQGGSTRETNTR